MNREAPSVAAATSKRRSDARSAPSTASTRNGIATNTCAMTTAAEVNGMPNGRNCPISPRRPRSSEERDAADDGRQHERHGDQRAEQAPRHRAPRRRAREHQGERHAEHQRDERSRAPRWPARGRVPHDRALASSLGSSAHGARTTSATRGSASSASAIAGRDPERRREPPARAETPRAHRSRTSPGSPDPGRRARRP